MCPPVTSTTKDPGLLRISKQDHVSNNGDPSIAPDGARVALDPYPHATA